MTPRLIRLSTRPPLKTTTEWADKRKKDKGSRITRLRGAIVNAEGNIISANRRHKEYVAKQQAVKTRCMDELLKLGQSMGFRDAPVDGIGAITQKGLNHE